MDSFQRICAYKQSQNDLLVWYYSQVPKLKFSNITIAISNLFETKDGIFVKNARESSIYER